MQMDPEFPFDTLSFYLCVCVVVQIVVVVVHCNELVLQRVSWQPEPNPLNSRTGLDYDR